MPDARPRYPRSSCIVPFCRRTSTRFRDEWVCGEHWRLVDRSLKRFRSQRLRKAARLFDRYEAEHAALVAAFVTGSDHMPLVIAANRQLWARDRWRRIEAATWRRMKDQAITRAAASPI